jgi:hypothetical protein
MLQFSMMLSTGVFLLELLSLFPHHYGTSAAKACDPHRRQ